MKYSINLVRQARIEQKKNEANRVRVVSICAACFGLLALALFYSLLQVLSMRSQIAFEKQNLKRIDAEYRKYKETRMVIDKADIELLSRIQASRIYWTKKLATMAQYLPDNYWINRFSYEQQRYSVAGYGFITPRQEQLITLDDYLNSLRTDSLYFDVFKTTYLKSMVRTDEGARERVSFEYNSLSERRALQ